MMLVIALMAAAYGGISFVVSERVEEALLTTMIEREVDFLSDLIHTQRIVELPQSKQTKAWFEKSGHGHIPAVFASLSIGEPHEVNIGHEVFFVQRKQVDEGVLTVALDITTFEEREHQFQLVMIIGGFLVSALALLAAVALSMRVAAPIMRLSAELKRLPADELERRFSSRYRDSEIKGIAEALDNYMERMERMVERERGFAAAASHEIRSPLTVIRSALELMEFDSTLSDSSRRTVARAQRSAKSLSLVMDGLFELAREPDAAALVEALNAVPVVDQVIDEVATSDSIRGRLKWAVPEEPVMLPVKEAHWQILVRNLVNNAVNHAPEGDIEVTLDSTQFSIRDHGPGIDPNVMPHLFERSQRGVESSGAGLGLYIVRELAERQSWTLDVRNETSGGCRFTVNFQQHSRKNQPNNLTLTER